MAEKKSKKKIEKKETEKTESPEEQTGDLTEKVDKQLYWVLGILAGLIIVFLVSYYLIFPILNPRTFEVSGLEFTKTTFGEIPIFQHSYLFVDAAGEKVLYNLNLRIDPRENNVSIDGEIVLKSGKTTYVSVNGTGIEGCEYGNVGIANLAAFLTDNMVPVKGASPDQEIANASNVVYATCETHLDNPVMLIQSGEETKIVKETNNCYVVSIANCEILEAMEKLQFRATVDARSRQI